MSRAIQRAAVIGAGAMGRGIAMTLAGAEIRVQLTDTSAAAVDRALAAIRASYASAVSKGRLREDDAQARLARVTPSSKDDASLAGVDIAVEAAFERLEVKREIFGWLDGVVGADAVLATNTSYLDVDLIAEGADRPERVIGLHFFNPAQVMRLVEIVPGRATAPDVVASCEALVERLGKIGVVAGNGPGFIGNRMLRVYRHEAICLLEEGATPAEVDRALEEFGMAMGPFRMQDLAGLDIAMASGAVHSRVFDELCARRRFGQKTGAGWYRYDGRVAYPDDEVTAIIERASAAAGIARRQISPDEIVERTIGALAAEGRRILEDKCARSASDIDAVWVHGYGFPAAKGGPMKYK